MKANFTITLIIGLVSFSRAFNGALQNPKRSSGVFVKATAANSIVRRIAATVVPQETEEEREGRISVYLKQIQPALAQCWPLVQLGVAAALVLKGYLTLQQIGDTIGGGINNAGERIGSGLQNISIAGHDIAGALNNAGQNIASGLNNISVGNLTFSWWNKPKEQ